MGAPAASVPLGQSITLPAHAPTEPPPLQDVQPPQQPRRHRHDHQRKPKSHTDVDLTPEVLVPQRPPTHALERSAIHAETNPGHAVEITEPSYSPGVYPHGAPGKTPKGQAHLSGSTVSQPAPGPRRPHPTAEQPHPHDHHRDHKPSPPRRSIQPAEAFFFGRTLRLPSSSTYITTSKGPHALILAVHAFASCSPYQASSSLPTIAPAMCPGLQRSRQTSSPAPLSPDGSQPLRPHPRAATSISPGPSRS